MHKPAEIKIALTKEEATLLMLAYESGVLSLDNFNVLATSVLGMKIPPDRHREMMDRAIKLQKELIKQIYRKKEESKIIL